MQKRYRVTFDGMRGRNCKTGVSPEVARES